MNMRPRDPIQEAVDQTGGFEGPLLKHNLKEGVVYLGGVAVGPDFKACLLLSTAQHGRLRFEDNVLVERGELRLFTDVAPEPWSKDWDMGWSPSTVCLAVSADAQLTTYSGLSWGIRSAFISQLLRSFSRLRQR